MLHTIQKNDSNQYDIKNIPISIYSSKTNPIADKTLIISWAKLCNQLTTPVESADKDIPLFGPYGLNTRLTRANENVLNVSLLVFDIDDPKGRGIDEIIGLVAKYDAIAHTTWKSTHDKPRYRLIIRLEQPVPAERFAAIRDGFLFHNPLLEALIDSSCLDISRAYYLFSCPINQSGDARSMVNGGRPLKLVECFMPIDQTTSAKSIAEGVMEGGRNTALSKYVGSLISQGYPASETEEMALTWNEELDSPMDEPEVIRTHDSIWKTHNRKQQAHLSNANQAGISKQFTLIPASDLLATPPPPREWLLTEFLPKKIVASIIAAGGTGKSFLAMHIAVALAAGSSLFSKYIATAPSKAVFISGEDDRIELQRRLHSVTQGMPPNLVKSISSNIQFIDLADSFELFTYKPPSGEVSMTTVPVDLVNAIKQKLGDEVGLVIVDPVSRFRGGEENSAGDTTRFVQALQYIRDQLNTTVLTLHHVNKGAKSSGVGQNNARGSSAFIDGVRLVYELNAFSEDEVKKQYGANGVIPRLMALSCVKSNYGKPIEPLTLSKKMDGSLELFTMQAGQHQKLAILQEIKISQLSKTQFKQTYGSATGKFGLSEKALVQKLDEYAKESLITMPSRAAMQLTQSGDSLLTI